MRTQQLQVTFSIKFHKNGINKYSQPIFQHQKINVISTLSINVEIILVIKNYFGPSEEDKLGLHKQPY